MFVTASSVRSLQAKQGLPLVNQVVGWIVLGLLGLSIAHDGQLDPECYLWTACDSRSSLGAGAQRNLARRILLQMHGLEQSVYDDSSTLV